MSASLYHRGSISLRLPAPGCRLPDDEDMRNALRRIELHEIPFSAPPVASSVEQVFDDVQVARIKSHLPDRHLHPSLLGPVRIGVGNDKDSFGSFGAFGAFGSFESFGSFWCGL